jgi:hypothetical protein
MTIVKCPNCGHSFGESAYLSCIVPNFARCPDCNRWLNLTSLRWKSNNDSVKFNGEQND